MTNDAVTRVKERAGRLISAVIDRRYRSEIYHLAKLVI